MIEFIKKLLRPYGKGWFVSQLDPKATILDVGCGNNSPYKVKLFLPHCHYTGIDIELHKHTKPLLTDVYVESSPDEFAADIERLDVLFDGVISSHNLEHCNERDRTLLAMLNKVKPAGKIFISFPTENSIVFPSRKGTLNYFDDETHKQKPPHFQKVLRTLNENDFNIIYKNKNYAPKFLYHVGLIFEPLSKLLAKKMIGTWEYYGFESIIIAEKIDTGFTQSEEV